MRQVLAVVVACLVFAQVTAAQMPAIHLADGTKIPLRLVQTISSGTAKNGDVVNFEVIEDIEVDGTVVIKKGTPVRGVVVEAAEKRRMGRAGKLSYTVADTKTVDRQTIRLRATSEKSGDSHVTGVAVTTVAVAVLVPVAAPFFLLRKGKDIVVPEGTRVDAFVDGEHQLTRAVAVAPALSPAVEKAVALTNADVLALAKAGFSDALIIAKIRGSASAYRLSPTELVQLKTAGLSERVITAMVEASK